MIPINTADGLFHDGNPVTGLRGTKLAADWHNAVQAELLAPIMAAGLTPDGNNNAQLLAAIQALIKAQTDALAAGTSPSILRLLNQYGIGTTDLQDWTGDLNNLTTSGLWFATTQTNTPDNSLPAGWFVIVLPNANGSYAMQIALPQGGATALWVRSQVAGQWSAWSKQAANDSPALTGTPTAPTPAVGDNSARIPTTAFVQSALAALVGQTLGGDANFANTVMGLLNGKAPLNSPTLTGAPSAPSPDANDNSTRLATTASVWGLFNKFGFGASTLQVWQGDMNALTTSGLWFGQTGTNVPRPGVTGWFVIVLPNANGTYAIQITLPQATGLNELWIRTQLDSTWSPWLLLAGNDSPAFTGTPTAPTPMLGSAGKQIINAEYLIQFITNYMARAFAWSTGSSAGYTQLLNGFILQWGSFSTSWSGFSTLTFPMAFPNALLTINGTLTESSAGNFCPAFDMGTASKTGISAALFNASSPAGPFAGTMNWIAIGM